MTELSEQESYHLAVADINAGLDTCITDLGATATDYEEEQNLATAAQIAFSGLVAALARIQAHHDETVMPSHQRAGETLSGEGYEKGAPSVMHRFVEAFPNRDDRDYLRQADTGLRVMHDTTVGEGESREGGSLDQTGKAISANYETISKTLEDLKIFFGTEAEPGTMHGMLKGLPEDYMAVATQAGVVQETLTTQRAIT